MVFYPPSWVPKLPIDPPDSIPIIEFMRNEQYGRRPFSKSRNPFTCGLTGRTITHAQAFHRSECLARALSKRLGWAPNEGTAWNKVLGIFSFNTIDYIPTAYAAHHLSGIASLANAAYSVPELTHQLTSSGVKVLFTCSALLGTALCAADAAGIARKHVFILPMVGDDKKETVKRQASDSDSDSFLTIEDLISEGEKLPALEPLRWSKGQGARQPAFLCYSSGTSGLPKAVMISHRNVIANTLQYTAYESVGRRQRGVETQVELGLVPMSHIYGLVVVSHGATWRGDEVIVLPKFELESYLAAIETFKIEHLVIVPPIIIRMLQSRHLCKKYNLSSVRLVYSGAAPLGKETIEELLQLYPTWTVVQAYGMTESCVVVCSTSEHDVMHRSSGSLLPGFRAKIVDPQNNEITEYDRPGELLVQSPSVVLGYMDNEKSTAETFVYHDDGRWLRTGDEVVVTKAPSGNDHFVVVDRIKELIKVKGHQVAPAELEAHILAHPAVADCAVIQVPDDRSGEVPKAFVVRSPGFASQPAEQVAQIITKHVADHKASYKWIRGGVEFLDEIPKSPSGKILRRLLRDAEKERRRNEGSRL
ncbi:acetyl-CoA synthetase-like protein [Parathielavia appendiculata]|uniref:Acetyl-CoA synthetase-like protein n=1 Tax=Parathielavia appendiculata TaxID=2587402 RepID=A0AAN6TT13_9PEZI|nr:acetyl-CoA synthetase-like protein [Parathielavia appendiculata]